MENIQIAKAINVALDAKEIVYQALYRQCKDIEDSILRIYPDEFLKSKRSFVEKLTNSRYSLAHCDPLIIAEYIYCTLNVNQKEPPIDFTQRMANTMCDSGLGSWGITNCGFTWINNHKYTNLWEGIIANSYIDDLRFIENIRNLDCFTIFKISKRYHEIQSRKRFLRFCGTKKEQLFIYEISPEIVESYISGCGVDTRDPNDFAIYKDILNGKEE